MGTGSKLIFQTAQVFVFWFFIVSRASPGATFRRTITGFLRLYYSMDDGGRAGIQCVRGGR